MATEALRWPKIPARIEGMGGPITIHFRKDVRVDGDRCYGAWDDERRTISLSFGMSRAHQWRILCHELVHAAMHDAGIRRLLTEDSEEALCDAIASARVAEMRGILIAQCHPE